MKVSGGARMSSWKDSDSGVSNGWSRRVLNVSRVSFLFRHLLFLNACYSFGLQLHTPFLHHSLAVPCLFLEIAVFPAHFQTTTPCTLSMFLGTPGCKAMQSSSGWRHPADRCSCAFWRDACQSFSAQLLLQHHFDMAGLALAQGGKQAMGKGEEREEGQTLILGLCHAFSGEVGRVENHGI